MGNDLVKNSYWTPFLTESNSSYTFNQFIDLIRKLDNDTSPDIWTKWKNYANQVVIETPHYFYKIYQSDVGVGSFYALIREKLAEIYRDEFHIHWDVKTIYKDDYIYQFEQREKLQVCDESVISFDDLMINWSKTLQLLEDKLILPKIAAQLKDKIPQLDSLKLVRDCVNKFEDYAITKDGNIVLLDDSDWFIGIIDEDNDWISSQFNAYPILTKEGERLFAPQKYLEKLKYGTLINCTGDMMNKWTIIYMNKTTDEKKTILDFCNDRERMISENIKVLKTGTYLPNDKKLELGPPEPQFEEGRFIGYYEPHKMLEKRED